MIVRKLGNFSDPSLDAQIIEIVNGVNNLTVSELSIQSTVSGNCTDLPTAIVLINQIKSALVANGIIV